MRSAATARGRSTMARAALSWAGGAAAAAILVSCAVGPNYHRPQTPVDTQFANAGEQGLAAGDAVDRYWTAFEDPLLDSLIEDALSHNKDLGVAEANLRAARAAKRLAGFDQYPTVTFDGGYTHNLDSLEELPGYTQNQRQFRVASMVCGNSIFSAASGAMSKRRAETWARALRRCGTRGSASSRRWHAITSFCAACRTSYP